MKNNNLKPNSILSNNFLLDKAVADLGTLQSKIEPLFAVQSDLSHQISKLNFGLSESVNISGQQSRPNFE